MARTITTDISRMIVAGQKEIFLKNFESFPLEYPGFTTPKKATKKAETYDGMGNLGATVEKVEGNAIVYNKVEQAYQTTVTNKTWANGFQHTMEAIKYDLYGTARSAKAKELSRTMREAEETRAILRFDNAFATNLADGAPLCTNSRPQFNTGGFNDTLTTGALSPTTLNGAVQMFSQFKNHQGGPMKCIPTDGMTHAYNMLTVEEIMKSVLRAYELSNTKTVTPNLSWHYSHYLTSTTAWFIWDRNFEHVLMQWFMKTQFGEDEDKINTKDMYFNSVAIYESGVLPNVGIVGSVGT